MYIVCNARNAGFMCLLCAFSFCSHTCKVCAGLSQHCWATENAKTPMSAPKPNFTTLQTSFSLIFVSAHTPRLTLSNHVIGFNIHLLFIKLFPWQRRSLGSFHARGGGFRKLKFLSQVSKMNHAISAMHSWSEYLEFLWITFLNLCRQLLWATRVWKSHRDIEDSSWELNSQRRRPSTLRSWHGVIGKTILKLCGLHFL